MDEDSSWLCTQAMHDCADDHPTDRKDKANSFGRIVLNNMDDNECYVLNEGDNTIGRHPLNHIYIEHPSVSMNHAVIQCDSDGVVLLDKGSLNKTKLNKKTLKKNVAYFLEENVSLMFGEIKANYYVDGEPTESSKEVKAIAANGTSLDNVIDNHEFPTSQLPCSVNTSNVHCNKEITNKVSGDNSTNKTEIIVSKTITQSECVKNKHDDAYLESNHSSPSDAFLLDAVSQIESQFLPGIVREDTPSPVMDFGNPLSNINYFSSNTCQTPNKMNSRETRDETPSPVFFGPLESYELLTPITDCHIGPVVNELTNNIDDLNETQCLEIKNNVKESISNTMNSITKLSSTVHEKETHTTKNLNSIQKLPLTVHEEETQDLSKTVQLCKAGLSNSKNFISGLHEDLAKIPDIDDDFFNCPTQKVPVTKKIITAESLSAKHDQETQKLSEYVYPNINDSSYIKNSSSGVHRDLTETPDLNNEDFFNCPTQKVSVSKCLNSIQKLSSTVHEEEKQETSKTVQSYIAGLNNSKNYNSGLHEDIAKMPDIDDDFFNCPTQKVPVAKKIVTTGSLSAKHDQETQKRSEYVYPNINDSSCIKNSSSGVYRDLTETPDVDSEDFFNCPTQKVSVSKCLNSIPKLSSTINEEETQDLSKSVQLCKAGLSNSKNYNSGLHEDLAKIPDIDDDFFNCPTQKVPVTKKIITAESLSAKHYQETQKLSEYVYPNINDSSCIKNSSSGVYRDLTETPDLDNEDFFNCPTQKVSVSKCLNSIPKLSSTVHEEETQETSKTVQSYIAGLSNSKNCNSGLHEDIAKMPDIDDDFFNCPTQKLPVAKKIVTTGSLSAKHDQETQKRSEYVYPNINDSSCIKNSSSGVYRDLTETPDLDNEDFFNCPTQKVSVSKCLNSIQKLSSTVHEEKTQEESKTVQSYIAGLSNSKNGNSGLHEDITKMPNIDDDFFNCPTQKVPVAKKIVTTGSLSAKHDHETQKLSEYVYPNINDSSCIKNSSSGVYRDLTETPDVDSEDFFNCPTQKVSVSKCLNSIPKLSSTVHEEETQKTSKTVQSYIAGLSNSKNCNSGLHEDIAKMPDIDDGFFNCPTQKLPVAKKIVTTGSLSAKHDQETQKRSEYVYPNINDSSCIKNSSSGVYRDLTETPDLDNEDFFNCPIQKVSVSKCLNSIQKLSSTVHEEKTQEKSKTVQSYIAGLSNSKNGNSGLHEDITKMPNIDDDFFNCPTQKVPVAKKIVTTGSLSAKHDHETQKLSEYVYPNINDSSCIKNSSSGVYRDLTETPDLDNEDFFNCPTQKVSVSKCLNSIPKLSSTVHEEETQETPKTVQLYIAGLSNSKNCNSGLHEDIDKIPDIDDDFFNCPTQKLPVAKKIVTTGSLSAKHDQETQKRSEYVYPNINDSSCIKNSSSGVYRDLTETPDLDNEDFFNCPTQKVSVSKCLNSIQKLSSTVHEEKTQEESKTVQSYIAGLSNSKNGNSGLHEDITKMPNIDDDFFNCPTQKVPVAKKIVTTGSLSAKHDHETQKLSEYVYPNINDSSCIKNSSSGVYRDLTETPDVDSEDFFNCPTQKVSVSKCLNSIPKLSSTVHEEETQKTSKTVQSYIAGLSNSKNCNSGLHEDIAKMPDIDDGFFNCPTQKLPVAKKIVTTGSLSAKHDQETQKRSEYVYPNINDSSCIKNSSSGVYRDLTETPDLDNEDFFNCPIQKVSVSKCLNSIQKLSSTVHEEKTQEKSKTVQSYIAGLSNSKNGNSGLHEDITKMPNIDDDFFNCPTQKVPVAKKIVTTGSLSAKHDHETQKLSEYVYPNINDSSCIKNSSSGVYRDLTETPDLDNEDFFNCPTQKVSVSKCLNSIPKLSSTVHEEETQETPKTVQLYIAGLSNSKNCNSGLHEDIDKIPDIDDDFFNCPTQKLPVAKKIVTTGSLSAKHDQETQKLSEYVYPNINDSSCIKNSSSGIYRDLTETPDLDNEDFFNCPTQKLSYSVQSKSSTSIQNQETSASTIIETENQDLLVQKNTRMPFSKINSPECSEKPNKENIVGKIPNKHLYNSSNINENENKDFIVVTNNENKSVKQKRTILSNDTKDCLIRKSMRLESNSNNKSKNIHQPVIINENKCTSKHLKSKKKPLIRVRKDLHKSSSVRSSNNSLNNTNTILDDVMVSGSKNMISSACSKIENERKKSSIKHEHCSDDSIDFQINNSNNNKSLAKQNNETIFNPLNIPNLSENVFQQNSTPIALESNLISLNCEPSCSNTAVTKWKLFWNKKKSACEDKGKSGKQENVKNSKADKIKNRYQTRAIVKREHSTENNKKRKQDSVIVEDKNKRLCDEDRDNKLNPLIPSTEIVVSFSFLKSRHLQELKKFIDSTGGFVTDEITQCNVLVTDKIRCTMKILSAIAKGCPIVNVNWIKHSYTVKSFQDVDEFLITDKDAERKYKFQLKDSLARAKTNRLLEGYTVLVTPSVKPGLKDMKVIITCAGGNFIMNWPIKRVQKELIVTCDQDRRRWKSIWDNSTAKIIDSDTLVMSIIRQKLNV